VTVLLEYFILSKPNSSNENIVCTVRVVDCLLVIEHLYMTFDYLCCLPKELQIVASDDKHDGIINETIWTADDSQNSGLIYNGLLWLARSFMRASFIYTLFAMMVREHDFSVSLMSSKNI